MDSARNFEGAVVGVGVVCDNGAFVTGACDGVTGAGVKLMGEAGCVTTILVGLVGVVGEVPRTMGDANRSTAHHMVPRMHVEAAYDALMPRV